MKPPSPILLIHGALGSAASFKPLIPLLEAQSFKVHTFDLGGHGANSYYGPLSMRLFGEEVLAYLDKHGLHSVSIFGFSMGGYAALQLASIAPQRIDSILTLGTKWDWDLAQIERETTPLNPDFLLEKAPKYAAKLEETHTGQGWRPLLARTSELLNRLAKEGGFSTELATKIQTPVRILLGDSDKMVTRDVSEAMAAALPQGSFRMLPNTPHPLEKVDSSLLVQEMLEVF